jgi:hypothetical protein
MIAASYGVAVLRRLRPSRNGTRVERGASGAGTGDAGQRGAEAPGRAIVTVEPAAREEVERGFARVRHSAPFLAQLASGYLGAADGERRASRDPAAVAPRASGAYRAQDRLASDIEPGFLTRREF